MRGILLLICLSLFSCELHEQTNITGEKVEARIISLSIIEEISSAIVKNDYATVANVLESGNFEINIPDQAGELILNKAIKNHRFVIGKLLIDKGARPEMEDGNGQTALALSQEGEFSADWSALFERGGISPKTANKQIFDLLDVANPTNEARFIPSVRDYFNIGASFDGVNDGMFTYLMVASSKNLIKTVALLCEFPGIDPNITVKRGRGRRTKVFSALSLAASDEMRALLTKCGAVQ